MKKLLVILMAVSMVSLVGEAIAFDTATITVQAQVAGTCKFSPVGAATATLDFGTLDPSVGNNVNAQTTLQFWCTKGVTTETFAVNQGTNWGSGTQNMLDQGTSGDLIPYTISVTPDLQANGGPNNPRTLTVNGTVLGTNYLDKSAGIYQDQVTVDINP